MHIFVSLFASVYMHDVRAVCMYGTRIYIYSVPSVFVFVPRTTTFHTVPSVRPIRVTPFESEVGWVLGIELRVEWSDGPPSGRVCKKKKRKKRNKKQKTPLVHLMCFFFF